MELAWLDWLVIALYFIFIAGVGLYVGRSVKDTDHYFMGKRGFGRWLMVGQSFGVGTHAEMPVSLAGAVYSIGASGIWYQWKNLFATPFYWLIAPVFRRFRRTTMAEVMEDRYGPWIGVVYVVFALGFMTLATASMLKGAAKVIAEAGGGGIGVNMIMLGMTAAFLAYSFVGGLVAAAWTDFFQGMLIIVLSFMLIPLGFSAIGGPSGLAGSVEPYKLSLTAPEGLGIWVILALTVNGLVGIIPQPHMIAAVGTGKTEKACREGFFYGNWVKRFCTVGWALVGLIVVAMISQGRFGATSLDDPEHAFGFACRHLLFPGGVGLLIAGVLAANMSTCSAFMVDSAALFTQSFYRRFVSSTRSDRHYLLVGRISGVGIALAGVAYAFLFIDRVLNAFLLTETIATYMGICVLGGVIWKRGNRWGAIASLGVALAVNFGLYYAAGKRLDAWEPGVFAVALASGIGAFVLVSLVTPAEPADKITHFFTNLHTPTDGGAGEQRELLLVNALQPMKAAGAQGFFRAYATDLRGFIVGWLIAIGLVAGLWLLFRIWF